MPAYRFNHAIEIRYGDLDPQGHLNNAKYLTFFEQARIHYLKQLGLFREGQSFLEIGVILAEVKISFLAPVEFGTPASVGMRVSHLGNKSMLSEYALCNRDTGEELANGSAVLVAYDYRMQKSIPLPAHWRSKIAAFEPDL